MLAYYRRQCCCEQLALFNPSFVVRLRSNLSCLTLAQSCTQLATRGKQAAVLFGVVLHTLPCHRV